MVSGKSTRWDCDVNLWRGIPDSFPSFHGWRSGVIHGSSDYSEPTTDSRFYVCHHCNSYVPEVDVPSHSCWDYSEGKDGEDKLDDTPPTISDPPRKDYYYDGHVHDRSDWRKAKIPEKDRPKFVLASEENTPENGKCYLCMERLRLQYDNDSEEWIYPGCIRIDEGVVHEACYSVIYE